MPSLSQLPPLVVPHGDGDMPLYCAAQWIATAAGAKPIDLNDESAWAPAFRQLLEAIVSGKIKVTGTDENGERVIVPAHRFSSCATMLPYHTMDFDLARGSRAWLLQSFPYEDEEEWDDWKDGFSDALVNEKGRGWCQLTILKSEVLERWPFDGPDQYNSGKPGRPSPKDLIEGEFAAIAERGELVSGIGRQSRVLADWLENTHPNATQIGEKSIAALIRERGYWDQIGMKK